MLNTLKKNVGRLPKMLGKLPTNIVRFSSDQTG